MKLNAKPLKNYQNPNSFEEGSEWNHMLGEVNTLYFKLVDLDQEGLRYLPAAPTVITVTFPKLNASENVVKTAVQVTPNDTSLWSVQLLSNEAPSSGNVQISVSEAGNVRRFVIQQGIAVSTLNMGGC